MVQIIGFVIHAIVPCSHSRTPCQPAFLLPLLCHQLDDTTSLCDFALGILADISGAHDEGNIGASSLSEKLRVSEGQQVDDGGCVFRLAGDVLLAQILGKKGSELERKGILVRPTS